MITKISNGIIIGENETIKGKSLYAKDGMITAVTNDELPFDKEIDAGGCYVSPGFIDLHLHGAMGNDFADGDVDAIIKAANYHYSHGTTTMFPTTLSASYEMLRKALSAVAEAAVSKRMLPHIAGVHLEGPYFSKKQCGAQNPDYITPPNESEYLKLIDEFKGIIKRWSFAPELEGSVRFVENLTENGIVSSIGHSDAKYEDVMSVYEKGCKLITHFYSCVSTITREKGYRKLGIVECGYLYDDIVVEAIADGHHIPKELFKMLYKIKGDDAVCLVTDAMSCCGIDAEESSIGGVPCKIKNGVACLMDESGFAGSIATADRLIRFCVNDVGIPICSAVKMMTVNPAKVMGLEKKGILKEGYDADIVIFDEDINIKEILVK
ncbi:MAG: N-acetylglucosamine-6-phosphate deacetylase [Clostridia bacterium]|nr:N-acetylglucosamine-6-phosphate deacetylase [Clostridia bacterium]